MRYIDYQGRDYGTEDALRVRSRRGIWAMLVDHKERILISHARYDRNFMELPGGGIEDGEDKATSLIREIEEEAGLIVSQLSPTKSFTQHAKFFAYNDTECWNYDQEYWLIPLPNDQYHFNGKRETEEGAAGEWLPLSSLNEKNCHNIHLQAMRKMEIL